jgi:protein TonB
MVKAAPPTPSASAPISPEIKAAPVAKIPFAPPAILAPPPAIPVPANSLYEVEEDPEIKPDVAEAALLESMPDPMAGNKISRETAPLGEARKQFAWQPVSKLSEPAPSAHAAEVSVTAEFAIPELPGELAETQPAGPRGKASSVPAPGFVGVGSGAAAATAPAKEIAPDKEPTEPPVFAPQTFASLGGKPERDSDGGASKKVVLVAAIIVLAAAGAYFGWTKLQHTTAVSSTPAVPVAVPAPQPLLQPNSTPAAADTTTTTPETAAPAGSEPVQAPDITLSTADTPAPKSKITVPSPRAAKSAAPVQPQETLIVKSETRMPQPPAAPAVEPVAPPDPGAVTAQNSSDNGISGIVNAPTAAAQPIAAIKVSQGVAQGLLMKHVPPSYPQQARQARIQGAVELLATIGKDGNITNLKQISGDQVLGRAAIEAVKQWKYRAYLLDGQPVEIQTQVTVNFTLP